MDPQIRTQLLLHPFDEQPGDMVEVHMRQHHVGHGGQPMTEQPGPREVRNFTANSAVDENGLSPAAHHDSVQRPIECVMR